MRTRFFKSILLAVALMAPLPANAKWGNGEPINGLYYWFDDDNLTAEVRNAYGDSYSGDITIPESVTYYGTTYCVTSIEEQAFYNCKDLSSITIPSSITSVGEYAFANCIGLTSVKISDLMAWCRVDFYSYSNPLLYAHNLYLNGNKITDLVIPSSITELKNYAFIGCSGLTSVTIPNSVTSIGNQAFYNCTGLTNLTIPNSVTSIGDAAFAACTGLTSIVVAQGNTVYDSRNNCNAIIETASNTLIVGCKNTSIPNSVTSIGDYAFYGCTGLSSITIPNSVTSIGDYAFGRCSGLTSVTIGNSVTTIGNRAFYGCSGLTSVTIPNSVTSIGSSAFYGTGIYNNHPNGVLYVDKWVCDYKGDEPSGNLILQSDSRGIANSAFSGCSGLTSVTIPNSVTTICDNAFEGCSGLTSVTIPNSVTAIGDGTFYGCSGLTSVTIPNSVTTIGDMAFARCDSLLTIRIGTSLNDIGNYAFACGNLKAIYNARPRPAAIDLNVFDGVDHNTCVLYVPRGYAQIYWANSEWNHFKIIEEWDPDDDPQDFEPGDVNGDGIVSGADVTALYNVLLDNAIVAGDADVNGDGIVSGADVTALYNLLLN